MKEILLVVGLVAVIFFLAKSDSAGAAAVRGGIKRVIDGFRPQAK